MKVGVRNTQSIEWPPEHVETIASGIGDTRQCASRWDQIQGSARPIAGAEGQSIQCGISEA